MYDYFQISWYLTSSHRVVELKFSGMMDNSLTNEDVHINYYDVKSPYTGDSIDSLAVINRLLISAPALNILTMSDYSFTLNDLDTLSSVLPHLTSISLIDCTLLSDSKHASVLIEPATSVASLSFDKIEIDVRSLEIEAELLMYISKKYPNLSTITLLYFNQLID
ncbi:hypothetical protein K501DRAFT_269150 [Backusella circina FSU 941]|nr:hypothetical protein K501DRAFT_269150 [Backusella circina FSU 941]